MPRLIDMSREEEAEAQEAFDDELKLESDIDSPRRKSASPFERAVTEKILSKTLLHTFRLMAALVKSDAKFADNEFDEPAKDIKEVINRFKLTRLVVNVWHPLVSASRLWDKAQKIKDGRTTKGEKPKPSVNDAKGTQGQESLGSMFGPSDDQFGPN